MTKAEYASFVAEDGVYLGLLDLQVLAVWHQKYCKVLYLELGQPARAQPLPEVISKLLGLTDSHAITAEDLGETSAEEWCLFSVRADYVKGYHNQCNHWLPAWDREALGPEFQVRACSAQADLAGRQLDLATKVQEITDQIQRGDGDETAELLLDSLMDQSAQLERQTQTFQELNDAGFCVEEVPADGNCCLWSLLALLNPDGNPEECIAGMRDLRQTLSAAWLSLVDSQIWRELFEHFGLEKELPAEVLREAEARDDDCNVQGASAAIEPKQMSQRRPAQFGKPKVGPDQGRRLKPPGPSEHKPKNKKKKLKQRMQDDAGATEEPEKPEEPEEIEEEREAGWAVIVVHDLSNNDLSIL